ncbi:MAG: hypothetical protein HQM15_00015 [Deltaproteobacteria bacterium]|nr:hypothetical protein [Deltaproteobacteria bacterium]
MNKIIQSLTILSIFVLSTFSTNFVRADAGAHAPDAAVFTVPSVPMGIEHLPIPAGTGPLGDTNYYVSSSGVDTNPCTTPTRPCLTINGAVSKIPDANTDPLIIRLAAGNYAPVTISNKNVILQGSSALDTRIDGGYSQASLSVSSSATVVLQDLAVVNGGGALFCGGAINNHASLTLKRVAVMNSTALGGGGICNYPGASLVVEDSSITGNVATGSGAGIYNVGTMSLLNTTVSMNWTNGSGGGLYLGTGSHNEISFSSITSNVSNADRHLSSSTGAGLFLVDRSTSSIKNSIVANNVGGTGAVGGTELASSDCATDAGGTISFSRSGTNLFSSTVSDTCNITATPNLNLGLVFYNGGSTLSQLIQAGSPATDAATDCSDVDSNLVDHDQRGIPRSATLYGTCDVGAFEATPILAPVYLGAAPASGPAPELWLNFINFGDVPQGSTATYYLRLRNMGQTPLNVGTSHFDPAPGFSTTAFNWHAGHPVAAGATDPCSVVAVGDFCVVAVNFTPDHVGAISSHLSFTGNNPAIFAALAPITLSGNGVVRPASFSLSSTPGPNVSINLGGTLPIQVTLTPGSGFSGGSPTFSLHETSPGTLPHGLVARFSDYNASTHQTTLTLSIGTDGAVTTTPAALQIQATVGSETIQIPLNLTVNPVGGPSGPTAPISLALSSNTASLIQGQTSAAINVTLTRSSFPGVVVLSLEGDNVDGVTANFTPNNLTANDSVLTFTASPTAAAGVRNLQVVATGGGTVQRAAFTLTIVSSSAAAPGAAPAPGDGSVDAPLPGSGGGSGGCSLDASSVSASSYWILLSLPALLMLRLRRRD